MDFDFLVDHARKNVWSTPRQDQTAILHPARLTARHGAFKSYKLLWRDISLPDTTSRWHVYQIGGIHPMAFNLFSKCYTWVSLAETCNAQEMIADVYGASGIKLPLFDTFYCYTVDNNLILAVKINSKVPINLNDEDVFLRVYSNAFFASSRSDALVDKLHVEGKHLQSAAERTTFKTTFDSYRAKPGFTWLYINGVMHKEWVDANAAIGSVVEFIYDPSVKKTLNFTIKDLKTFSSTLDEKLKYLVHYSGASDNTIDYQDDIDVYVSRPDDTAGFKSVYYNKNNADAMRNLTHRDYSLVSSYIRRYTDTLETLSTPKATLDPLNMNVDVYIRNSGYSRALVYENSRIHELYKMNDLDVLRAMVGIDATVDVWKAENLEKAAYPLVMRSACCDITNEMVQNAYGYNAITKAIADTPKEPVDWEGQKAVPVPYKLQVGSTAYEYDAQGLMIGRHHHYTGDWYILNNQQAAYVEMIAGIGSPVLDEYVNLASFEASDQYSYKVYSCTAISGYPDYKWVDVSYSNKYEIKDGVYTWTDQSLTSYQLVRSDKRFLARDLSLTTNDGILQFDLMQQVNTDGVVTDQIMQIPMGQLDVFLNGRSLIKDLDYFVQFPKVFIVNKKYLNRPIASERQNIHIRFAGFASTTFQMVSEGNRGYVEHGVLSNNSKFDLRDDKVQRVIVDGRLYTKSELIFSELHSGVNVVNALNGLPYMVKDILVPVKSNTTADTYELRTRSGIIDKEVSDYLTLKIPQPPRNAPSAIAERYQLFSPFCHKLIADLIFQRLILPNQSTGYTRQQILDICKPYEQFLVFDPTQVLRAQDMRYVVIHPHAKDSVLDLPKHQYQFMHQVVNYYTNDLVDLSQLIRMVE